MTKGIIWGSHDVSGWKEIADAFGISASYARRLWKRSQTWPKEIGRMPLHPVIKTMCAKRCDLAEWWEKAAPFLAQQKEAAAAERAAKPSVAKASDGSTASPRPRPKAA